MLFLSPYFLRANDGLKQPRLRPRFRFRLLHFISSKAAAAVGWVGIKSFMKSERSNRPLRTHLYLRR